MPLQIFCTRTHTHTQTLPHNHQIRGQQSTLGSPPTDYYQGSDDCSVAPPDRQNQVPFSKILPSGRRIIGIQNLITMTKRPIIKIGKGTKRYVLSSNVTNLPKQLLARNGSMCQNVSQLFNIESIERFQGVIRMKCFTIIHFLCNKNSYPLEHR